VVSSTSESRLSATMSEEWTSDRRFTDPSVRVGATSITPTPASAGCDVQHDLGTRVSCIEKS
jgi:hypothetical protein